MVLTAGVIGFAYQNAALIARVMKTEYGTNAMART
jgi:multisubunit Na+/H+ antiporter MnhC subunit